MPSGRSLAPREYGAYAELGFPVLTGLLGGGPSLAGAGFTLAALAGFFASEPAAVLAGARGTRVRRQVGRRAWLRLAVLCLLGMLGGAVGLLAGGPAARLAALVPAAFACALLPAVLRGRHKTLGAELVVAAALASMVLPVGIAGGMRPAAAAVAAGIWGSAFWLATLTVHAVKTRFKPALGPVWTLWAAPAFGCGIVVLALIGAGARRLPVPAALAVLPAALVAAVAWAAGVNPRHLRRVGWSLVVANLATFGLLLMAR